MLHILSRLFSVSPHLSSSLMDCLTAGDGSTVLGSLENKFTGLCIWDRVGGGVILSHSYFLDWSFESDRSTLEKASTALAFADV